MGGSAFYRFGDDGITACYIVDSPLTLPAYWRRYFYSPVLMTSTRKQVNCSAYWSLKVSHSILITTAWRRCHVLYIWRCMSVQGDVISIGSKWHRFKVVTIGGVLRVWTPRNFRQKFGMLYKCPHSRYGISNEKRIFIYCCISWRRDFCRNVGCKHTPTLNCKKKIPFGTRDATNDVNVTCLFFILNK